MLLSLLPFYLLSNIHCAGMCGPLVMLLSQNRAIWLYFVGRIIGFTLMASFALLLGHLIGGFFLPLSFIASTFIIFMGIIMIVPLRYSRFAIISGYASTLASKLIVLNTPIATFLFGLCTPLLPCGQSMILFSAAALSSSLYLAASQGALFAFATTPGLLCALFFSTLFKRLRLKSPLPLAIATIIVGLTLLLRALADLGIIEHLTLSTRFHLILY